MRDLPCKRLWRGQTRRVGEARVGSPTTLLILSIELLCLGHFNKDRRVGKLAIGTASEGREEAGRTDDESESERTEQYSHRIAV